ncbi:MAG: ABC transporter ATP-binding protein [Thermodesulfovibrionales bacterium]|nr:ABC transporter ATP-binding protein [Thermodesulfovibrionales bacterium]
MEVILELKNLNKHFDGIYVSKNINLKITKGSLTAIIGPNGAGKTSVFNLITGYIEKDSGEIFFQGIDITNKKPEHIASIGIVRAFQVANIFPDESVYDNVLIAGISLFKKSANFLSDKYSFKDIKEHTDMILKNLNLFNKKDLKASELSHGDQKILDIAMALTLSPKILLLDEPTAGMSPDERKSMVRVIKELHNKFNLTTLFIEHDMDIVFGIAEVIRVMVRGEIIAEGNAEEIRNNPLVIESYLGKEV